MQTLRNRLLKEGITETYKKIALIEIIIILLLFFFFSIHFIFNTGFYTSDFVIVNFFVLFGVLFLNISTIIIRLRLNSKNSTRPLRMLSNILTSIGLLIIIFDFPFNLNEFGAFIPLIGEALSEFMVTNIPLIMQLLVFFFTMFGVYDAVLIYLFNRGINFDVQPENKKIKENSS
ncbi:MAG: hypothetical protein HeimC3_27400 [Candidatus Heimdallarchaeota archaeon LC_3]|nr:MAG: hypothetical protein HeimC3_27400 [Candidatus Heimdallarchaeota archaeon LC_3]